MNLNFPKKTLKFGLYISVDLECGGKSLENSTYLTLSSKNTFNSDDQTCIYTICSMSPKICRIRFDFTVRYFWISFYFFNQKMALSFIFLIDFCNFGSKKRNYYRWCDIYYVRWQFRYFFLSIVWVLKIRFELW